MRKKNGEPRRRPDGTIRDWEDLETDHDRQEYFKSRVYFEPNTGCWLWALKAFNGYGYLMFGPARWKGGMYAHRFAYELFVGPIPAGADMCHKCDTRLCCNPAHLFPGSMSDNLRDCVNKDRSGRAKLTTESVKELRQMYADGASIAELSLRFGVGRTSVIKAARGETWRDVA